MIESEVEVRGPFATQPLLVKIGSLAAFAAFVVFGGFIPASLAVGVIMGVGEPAASWKGTIGPLALITGMAMIGAWTNCRFLRWLSSGVLSLRTRFLFVSSTAIMSAVVASVAAALGVWPTVFLTACALVPIGLLSSWVLIMLRQAVGGAK